MTRSSFILIAATSFAAGCLLGAGATFLLRIEAATRTDRTLHNADSIVSVILTSPDLENVRSQVREHPDSVNTPEFGLTPLQAAVSLWPDESELHAYLLSVGADPTQVCREAAPMLHHSALTYAAWRGDTELLQLLIDGITKSMDSIEDPGQLSRALALLAAEHPALTESVDWHGMVSTDHAADRLPPAATPDP